MIEPRKQVNNIYGYIRVSSEQQAKDGSSLDEQKKSIEESMLLGIKNSSSVISFMDAKTGLLGFDKLKKNN